MAMNEDAASVLDQFVQDVANLPAEIAHLLEEIQAKDRIIQECRNMVNSRDSCLQKFVKFNGAGKANPKEEAYAKNIIVSFEKAQIVQDEKVALSDKAAYLLDRQIKRLDLKIRDLQNDGSIAIDPQLPSLLNTSTLSDTRIPSLSASTPTTSTPLQPLSGNAGPSTTIANTPLARLVQPVPQAHRQPSPLRTTALAPLPANIPVASLITNSGNPTNPPQSSLLNSRLPPRSPSTESKRRRLNHLTIPQSASALRQSSLGPGTPKIPHPLAVSRGSSAGPRPASKKPSRPQPHQQRIGHLNPNSSSASRSGENINTNNKKPISRRRNPASKKANGSGTPGGVIAASGYLKPSPSEDTAGEESALSEVEGQEEGSDVDMEDAEGEGDDRKYCTCRSVSYGNMIACDNDDCPYEWFHWSCVGMTKEPVGAWYCVECRGKM